MKVGRVPHIPYHRPGASAAADAVAKTIARYAAQGSPVRAVMLARLGANVWHDTRRRHRHRHRHRYRYRYRYRCAGEYLEETARPWLLCPPRAADRAPDRRTAPYLSRAVARPTTRYDPAQDRKKPMPRFAANLSMLYSEADFPDRFAAAARDGFKAVEYLFPYAYPAQELAARLQANGLQQVLFNAPPGDWDAGERGLASLPGREAEFHHGIAQAIDYAKALQCPRIHVMAGLVPQGADADAVRATYIANVRYAAKQAAPHGIHILLEPINGRDMPGFFLRRQDQAHALIAAIGATNVKVQMDLYHAQIVEGDLAMKIRQYLPTGNVGHLQIAGVPERHEPDVGEVNYTYLFKLLDSLGYDGWIGCEYRPARGAAPHATSDGLGWLKPWL